MAVMIPTPQDKRLLLQDTVTKLASFDSAAFDLGVGYSPGGPGQQMSGVVAVIARDVTDGNETYSFTLQESADGVTFTACGAATAVSSLGVTFVKGVLSKRYIRLSLTTGGTTPSITYKAWLNPLR